MSPDPYSGWDIKDPYSLGLIIRYLRMVQGVTQQDVADAALGARTNSTNLSALERGHRACTMQTGISVLETLGHRLVVVPMHKEEACPEQLPDA